MAKLNKNGVLSLDLAARCSGWCYLVRDNLKAYGCIETNTKEKMASRLTYFKDQLIKVLKKFKPANVVIENGYLRGNVLTLKVLSYFVGVAKEAVYQTLKVEPVMATTTEVRRYFGANLGGKEEIFDFIVDFYELEGFKFDTHNDITDAIAQGLYYYLSEMKNEAWPEERKIHKTTPKPKRQRRKK